LHISLIRDANNEIETVRQACSIFWVEIRGREFESPHLHQKIGTATAVPIFVFTDFIRCLFYRFALIVPFRRHFLQVFVLFVLRLLHRFIMLMPRSITQKHIGYFERIGDKSRYLLVIFSDLFCVIRRAFFFRAIYFIDPSGFFAMLCIDYNLSGRLSQ